MARVTELCCRREEVERIDMTSASISLSFTAEGNGMEDALSEVIVLFIGLGFDTAWDGPNEGRLSKLGLPDVSMLLLAGV